MEVARLEYVCMAPGDSDDDETRLLCPAPKVGALNDDARLTSV